MPDKKVTNEEDSSEMKTYLEDTEEKEINKIQDIPGEQ